MANIHKLIPIILKWEGGFQNYKQDKGNYLNGVLIGTYKGITPATYFQFFKRVPTPEDMKSITDEQFTQILKKFYWDKVKADEIENQSIANIWVDWLWASGFGTPIKEVQKILNVVPDGVVGNRTLNVLNMSVHEKTFDKIKEVRKNFIYSIVSRNPSQLKFLDGWLNRLEDFKFE